MANVENLERLESLLKSLSPLASKQRGELIEAAQWNLLVEGVLEIARASLAEGAVETVPAHKHTDTVDVDWLTPKLRTILTEGGLADPAGEAQLAKLGRQVERLSARMDTLSDRFTRLQADLAGVQTSDVVRQAEVTKLGRQLDGVHDSREDVTRLRTSLEALSADVKLAVEAAGSLQQGGQIIDVAGLVGRVDALDGLRQALITPAGTLLSAAEYERRIEELRAQLVTETEFRDALDDLRGEFGGLDFAGILDEARLAGRLAADDAIATFRTENTTELDRRFAGIDATIDARVATATEDLATTVSDQARSQWEPALNDGLATLQRQIGEAEAARDAGTRSALRAEITSVQAAIPNQVNQAVQTATAAQLAQVQSHIDAQSAQLTRLEAQTTANTAAITTNATRIEVTRRNLEAADARLQESLTSRIVRVEESLDGRIDSRLVGLREGLRADLRTDVNALGRDLERRLDSGVRDRVVTEVGITSGRLRNEISSVVDAEVAAVREDINGRFESALNTNSARLSGMVTNEVRQATADLDGRVERAVNSFRPEIERMAAGRPAAPNG